MEVIDNIYEWSEAYSVGNEILDAQHRQMLSICRQLDGLDHCRDPGCIRVLESLVEELIEISLEHFQTEQVILTAIDYPNWEVEAVEHEAFIVKVTGILNDLRGNTADVIAIQTFLRTWTIDHLLHTDMQYQPFLSYHTA